MKLIVALLLIPVLAFSQKKSTAQLMKEAQAIADTMHFPDPFEFKFIDTVNLSKSIIYNKSLQWLAVVMGDFKRQLQIADTSNGKIVITNIEAVYNIYETMTIDIKEGRYRMTLDNYLDVSDPDSPKPFLPKKESKDLHLHKYFIVTQNEALFKSLKEYLRKNNDF